MIPLPAPRRMVGDACPACPACAPPGINANRIVEIVIGTVVVSAIFYAVRASVSK